MFSHSYLPGEKGGSGPHYSTIQFIDGALVSNRISDAKRDLSSLLGWPLPLSPRFVTRSWRRNSGPTASLRTPTRTHSGEAQRKSEAVRWEKDVAVLRAVAAAQTLSVRDQSSDLPDVQQILHAARSDPFRCYSTKCGFRSPLEMGLFMSS